MERMKKNRVLVGSNSIKAKIDNKITVMMEPTICTKLIINAKSPQKIGKLTSKNTQAKPVPIPVAKLIKNLTLMNLIRSFSILKKVLSEVCLCFKIVLFNTF